MCTKKIEERGIRDNQDEVKTKNEAINYYSCVLFGQIVELVMKYMMLAWRTQCTLDEREKNIKLWIIQ